MLREKRNYCYSLWTVLIYLMQLNQWDWISFYKFKSLRCKSYESNRYLNNVPPWSDFYFVLFFCRIFIWVMELHSSSSASETWKKTGIQNVWKRPHVNYEHNFWGFPCKWYVKPYLHENLGLEYMLTWDLICWPILMYFSTRL